MRLLTVFSHPVPTSYPGAVMRAFHEPFERAGHDVDVLDLHAEGFDPRFTEADHAHFWGAPVPEEIDAMHRRVEAADRLAFVFPVYWWGMPALMKGWLERVFTGGWAYQYGTGVADRGQQPLRSLLRNVPTELIGVGGSTERTYDKYGYAEAMRTQIDVGTFAYCGVTDVRSHLVFDVEGDHNQANREDGLRLARRVGAEFLDEHRPIRDAKAEHLARR